MSRSRSPIRWAPRSTASTPSGVLKSEGSSITEGIGQGRITANLEGFTPDFSCQVTDEEALPIVFDLVAGGGPVPRRLDRHQHRRRDPAGARARAGPHHRDDPCDYGTRYQSKLFNPEFLRSKNLPVPGWLERAPEISVPYEKVA